MLNNVTGECPSLSRDGLFVKTGLVVGNQDNGTTKFIQKY